jgi:hypothetical protein
MYRLVLPLYFDVLLTHTRRFQTYAAAVEFSREKFPGFSALEVWGLARVNDWPGIRVQFPLPKKRSLHAAKKRLADRPGV